MSALRYAWLTSGLRRLMFGDDYDLAYDPSEHLMVTMINRSMYWRFHSRAYYRSPWFKAKVWMMEWDARFRMRYLDCGGCLMERCTANEFYQ